MSDAVRNEVIRADAAQEIVFRKIPQAKRARIAASVLTRYAEGEQIADMAKQYGISAAAMYGLLVSQHPEAWKDVQIGRALERLAKAESEMDSAADGFKLAKAEKIVKSAHWQLERLFRELYGEDKQIQINVDMRSPEQVRDRIIELERRLGVKDGLAAQLEARPEE